MNKYYELFRKNFPFITRNEEEALNIINNPENKFIDVNDENGNLIATSIINKNTILMLCVNKEHRHKGIVTKLLNDSENYIFQKGYNEINIGVGDNYLMPGIPMATKPYNEQLKDALTDIVKSNPHIFNDENVKDGDANQMLQSVFGLRNDGDATNDNIAVASNVLNVEQGADVTQAIADKYGLTQEQLTNSAAGMNILNTIMLDPANNAIFDGQKIESQQDIINILNNSAQEGSFQLATSDTSVSFLKEGAENLTAEQAKAEALKSADYDIFGCFNILLGSI